MSGRLSPIDMAVASPTPAQPQPRAGMQTFLKTGCCALLGQYQTASLQSWSAHLAGDVE